MKKQLKQVLGLEAELIKGSGGEFEITVDRELIFSKRELNRFPDDGEVEKIIKDRK